MAKRIDKDTEVLIANNTRGGFFYSSKNGDSIIDLNDFGDEEYVSFGELKTIMGSKRSILQQGKLIIIDVEDNDITVEDVVKSLRLEDTYEQFNKMSCGDELSVETLENFISNSSTKELEQIVQDPKCKLKEVLLETAVSMHRRGVLSDYNKMQVISKTINSKDSQQYWIDVEIPTM